MYSLVVPVYNNEETIPDLLQALAKMNTALDGDLEAVFVLDGSPDNAHGLLQQELPKQDFASELICLARNFGSFAAIRTGLQAASGPYFAVMAADLQEPPELIVEFFRALESEPLDITLGVRESRDDPWLTKLASNLFWGAYRRLIQKDVPPGGVDVFGCNARVREVFLELNESNSTLIGLLFWVGFRRKTFPYHRSARAHGVSGWTLRKKVRYMLDSAYAFSDVPIYVLLVTGFVGICASITLAAIEFVEWAMGATPVRGYTPIILSILFSTSLILFGIGIVGGYVWRAFENTKGRPLFIMASREAFGKESER